jgi:hypothetical protein
MSWKRFALFCLHAAGSLGAPLEARCHNATNKLDQLSDTTKPADALAILQEVVMSNLKLEGRRNTPHGPECTLENAAVRRDWFVYMSPPL